MMTKGQSLFEVLFATALAALIVTGVVALALKSIGNADFARRQSTSRQTAQDMLEVARTFRDGSPDSFFDGTDPTFPDCPQAGEPCCPEDFNCDYTITRSPAPPNTDTVNVLAEVSWSDRTGTHTISAETILTDWEI